MRVATVPTVKQRRAHHDPPARPRVGAARSGRHRLRRRHLRADATSSSTGRTASCWSPGPPARARRPRSTPAWPKINSPDLNILTVEDPVEYQLEGICQTAGQREDRSHLRRRAALVPAPRPRRHHGRRDPRPRDRRDRDPGVAHRPPGALDHPHQRRRRRDHAPGRHGRAAVPGRLVAGGAAGPAAGAARVPRVPRGLRARPRRTCRARHRPGGVRRAVGAAPVRFKGDEAFAPPPGHAVPGARGRLPGLPRRRLQGPDRHLRAADHRREDPPADHQERRRADA